MSRRTGGQVPATPRIGRGTRRVPGGGMAHSRAPSPSREAPSSEPRATLSKAIDAIVQRFGKGAIMALGGDPGERQSYETVSTGSLNLDKALGVGGLPRGRIVEIFGPESSGKTT